ncbi:MAG: DUF4167 domain-containing protein [Pseudolabrys sp.]
MRNGQKRMRGRGNNHRKSQNPLTRVYESNGPDVKIRGTASHVAEKYIQLARDAQSSGDPVAAENSYQHAEHYFRLIAAAQEQFRQQNPYYQQQQQGGAPQGAADESFDDDGDDQPNYMGQNEPGFAPQPQQQPYLPRDAQPFPPRDQQQPRHQQQPYPQQHQQPSGEADMGGLPAFITGGGGQQQTAPNGANQNGQNGQGGQNGHEQGDRFGGHHRRRRRRGGGGGFRPERADFGSQPGADGGDQGGAE